MKVTFILQADVPESAIQGIKERAAMDLERYGDVKVVKITSSRSRASTSSYIFNHACGRKRKETEP